MPSEPQDSTAARLRLLLTDVVDLAAVRLDLLVVEARLETRRVAWMLALGVCGVVLLAFGVVFGAIWLTVLLWDTHRIAALTAFTVLFLAGGAVLLGLAWARMKQGARMFAATRAELQADKERLRP
jgi:uncharacterized membrane protein YqjE